MPRQHTPTASVKTTVGQMGLMVSGWGGVSSGLNPIIDASHCVPRQQYISNRALFKSSRLISGETARVDLALTGHTVPVKSDRVCVCLWRVRVCESKCTKKERVIWWRQEGGVCAGVRVGGSDESARSRARGVRDLLSRGRMSKNMRQSARPRCSRGPSGTPEHRDLLLPCARRSRHCVVLVPQRRPGSAPVTSAKL